MFSNTPKLRKKEIEAATQPFLSAKNREEIKEVYFTVTNWRIETLGGFGEGVM